MFTGLLERSSTWIVKLGMPLVYAYHLVLSSIFLNTAASDARGIEAVANQILIPTQYFLEGKWAQKDVDNTGQISYTLTRRFDYENHFFFKTAASIVALPVSLTVGSTLKGIAYLNLQVRERSDQIKAACYSRKIHSNDAYYKSIGLEIGNYQEAEMIAPPKWTRHPEASVETEGDLEALKAIVHILSERNIPFWIDCGSCLGCYQYGGAIPHDWDIDIGVLMNDFENVKNALHDLDPEKFVVQDWSGRKIPSSYLKVFVRETGGMIDLYNFAIDPENKTVHTVLSNEFNIFLPTSWKEREKRYTTPMPFSYIFPLKKALFEGVEVPVPGQTESYLQVFYGEDLAPAKLYNEISGTYEKDLSHSYWQLPNAH